MELENNPARLTSGDVCGILERRAALSLLTNSIYPLSCPSPNGVEQYPILPILISEGRVINENICKY